MTLFPAKNSVGIPVNPAITRGNFTQDGCQQFQDKELPKFPFLPFDNMIFIMFQAFQLYFCFNAIFHEHIIQILTITILNFCWALYGTVAVEVKIELGELNDLSKCVNQSSVVAPPDFLGNDIPCVIVLLMLAFIMSYLSYKLYKQFGWILLVFGVKVLRNFGQGLKELINKNETQEESTPQNPGGLAHIWDDLEFEP
ncbi:23954_t:CDS:2, partial [Gigaspora margarita]